MGDLASWCEIDLAALRANVKQIRSRLRPGCVLGVVVKADAYGHGMVCCAREAVAAGAQTLIVNDVNEARDLRAARITDDIYICGPVFQGQAAMAVETSASLVVSDLPLIEALSQAAVARQQTVSLHLKVETGTHRQGIAPKDVVDFARQIDTRPGIRLVGVTTHFADLEDAEDDQFARQQLERFGQARQRLAEAGFADLIEHTASSAAALLLPEAQGHMVRAGLIVYGLCPTPSMAHAVATRIDLQPVLSWRARLFPGSPVEAGETIGYGRTYRVGDGSPRRQAVLNVGYHEGFDRRRSNTG